MEAHRCVLRVCMFGILHVVSGTCNWSCTRCHHADGYASPELSQVQGEPTKKLLTLGCPSFLPWNPQGFQGSCASQRGPFGCLSFPSSTRYKPAKHRNKEIKKIEAVLARKQRFEYPNISMLLPADQSCFLGKLSFLNALDFTRVDK